MCCNLLGLCDKVAPSGHIHASQHKLTDFVPHEGCSRTAIHCCMRTHSSGGDTGSAEEQLALFALHRVLQDEVAFGAEQVVRDAFAQEAGRFKPHFCYVMLDGEITMPAEARSTRVILLTSVLSTTVAAFCMNPFEVIKTQLMAGDRHQSLSQSTTRLLRTHGPLVLFRGAHLSIVTSACSNSIYFLLYENLKTWMVSQIGHFGFGLSAFVSRTVAVTVMLPVEILKTRAYVRAEAGSLWKFHGLQTQVWRDLLWSSVFWQLFEESSRWTRSLGYSDTFSNTVPASLAGLVASLITHPLDVLKTRLQLHIPYSEFPLQGLSDLRKSSGWRFLFTGLTVRCLRTALSLPLFMYVYTHSRAYLVAKASGEP